MNTFFNLIQPISNLPIFIFLNLSICLIAIHWYWMKSTNNFSEKLHRNLQRIALFISILIIGILFVKQWNIGDLLAFYSVFSFIILTAALINNKLEIIKESRGWFVNIFLVFFLRGYVYEPWQIPSESMRPNLEIGDFVLVNRNAYGLEIPFTGREKLLSKGPEIGEIIVFFPPHKPTVPFVKRVIAKGGDTVTYVNKKYFVNGIMLSQEEFDENTNSDLLIESNGEKDYLIRHMTRRGQNGNWVIPEGMYFVSGDNRDNSNDSRAWGYISEDVIWGRADFIWMSWKSGEWPSFDRAGEIN